MSENGNVKETRLGDWNEIPPQIKACTTTGFQTEKLKPNSTPNTKEHWQRSRNKWVSNKGRIRRPTGGKQITGKASIIMVSDRYVSYIYRLARVCRIRWNVVI